jgi:hypothetical protein
VNLSQAQRGGLQKLLTVIEQDEGLDEHDYLDEDEVVGLRILLNDLNEELT